MSVLAQLALVLFLSSPAPAGALSGSAHEPVLALARCVTPGAAGAGSPCADRAGEYAGPGLLDEARQPAWRDAWLGDDKFRHFSMSFAAVGFSYGGARLVTIEQDAALSAAVVATAAAGLAKELVDRARGGPFSVRDLVWDAFGIGMGVLLMRQAQ